MKLLRHQEDLRSLFVVFLYFSSAIAPWFLWNELNNWQISAFILANCLLSFTCAVIVHNTIHTPMFYSAELNKINQVILSFTYGHPVSAFIPGHNYSHHKYTQTLKDNINTHKLRFKLNILNQLLFSFVISGAVFKSEMKFAARMRKIKPFWFKQYIIEFVIVISFKIALLILNWKCFLLFVFIPHQYSIWGILGTNFFQHDGCDV